MLELAFVRAERQNLFWIDIADALREELGALGVATSVHVGAFPEPRPGLVHVLAPPHELFALEPGLRPDHHALARSVLVCGEQPGSPHFLSDLPLALAAGATFDLSHAAVRAFRRHGVDAHQLQLGHTARWEGLRPGVQRDVDATFLGCKTDRRARALASYAPTLWRHRCHILLSDNGVPNERASARFADVGARTRLLGRSRVLLNVHQGDAAYFEWHRVVVAMLAGCAVVSEHASDTGPLEPGAHFVAGRWPTLAMLAQRLLDDEGRRAEMAAGAYAVLREQTPLRDAAATLATVAGEVARGAHDRPPGARATVQLPDRAPVPGDDERFQPPAVDDADANAVRRAIKDIRLDLMDNRRMLTRWRLEQRAGGPLPELEVIGETPAWTGARRRVSVITPVYNHGEHVGAALDTVAQGRFRDVELLVVDDGSTDDSVARTAAWMRRRPQLPVLHLRHPANRGLSHARNSGLGFARGELVLPLDADNEVFPTGLERLVEALDADPSAAFAYGILEVFTHAGPSHLTSAFPWEPRRLRAGNYIDALSVLRTDRLRAAGGYTTERRLHGWEDYALWCAFAERGEHGTFVREIVGRYRAALHSMLALTNISVTDALSLLAERYPEVMRGVRIPA